MKKPDFVGALCLFATALIWGTAFVMQDRAAFIGAFTLQTLRAFIAAAALSLLLLSRTLWRRSRGSFTAPEKSTVKRTLLCGVLCGVLLGAASVLQQFGIEKNVTSPGKDAFITALYIIFVPLLSLFFGKRAAPHVYLAVLVALGGLWLLCMSGSTLSTGDLLVIFCSLVFAVHIVTVDRVIGGVDSLALSTVQFCTMALFCLVCMLVFERPTLSNILAAKWEILYMGLISGAGGYTLQIVGQARTAPAVASLLMSLESVVAVIASALLIPNLPPFSAREYIGMALIFLAVVAAQLSFEKKKKI